MTDFVIYLGDVITANNIMIGNASLYWDQATSPARNRGIPWASVFGNHDDAPFQWPLDWFSAPGIPPIHCPQTSASCSGNNRQYIVIDTVIIVSIITFSRNKRPQTQFAQMQQDTFFW